jgi:enoyl-CoA hydratase/carnithine racemase
VDDRVGAALTHHKIGNYIVIDLADATVDETAAANVLLDMAELCDRISLDEQVRVVVLRFSGTLSELLCANPEQGCRGGTVSLVESIAKLKQPVIAAIRGDGIGLGLELALACDIRIGSASARFGLPQLFAGRMPSDGGTQRLPRLIGKGPALQMILTGERIDAEEAQRLGLLSRRVPPEEVSQAAVELASEMAEKSPVSLSYAKEAMYKGMDLTLDQGIGLEMDLYLHMFTTIDRIEGITAFREKRKPKFEGA